MLARRVSRDLAAARDARRAEERAAQRDDEANVAEAKRAKVRAERDGDAQEVLVEQLHDDAAAAHAAQRLAAREELAQRVLREMRVPVRNVDG